jgi:hypothetical protein
MNTLNSTHPDNTTPPRTILPVLEKLKTVYKLWHEYHELIPKSQKYSLGNKIDSIFIEIIEMVASAAFSTKTEKLPYVKLAIRKLDTLKILLMVLWESKGLDNKKYIHLSEHLHEIGKMLGGWLGQLTKQNSSTTEEK